MISFQVNEGIFSKILNIFEDNTFYENDRSARKKRRQSKKSESAQSK